MPPNTLRVHTEYVLVKSVGLKSCGLSHGRRRLENISLQFHAEIVEVEICGNAIYRPFGNFAELNRTVTYELIHVKSVDVQSPRVDAVLIYLSNPREWFLDHLTPSHPEPTYYYVSQVFIEFSTLKQMVAIHPGMATECGKSYSAARFSQWRYNPYCPVFKRKWTTASALSSSSG
ncbi:hypothetical protein TNCV_1338401 [Trichonephila clavipes]|nr:hypothetical protein TNCV_1338401 [Trichonephila clavipes]